MNPKIQYQTSEGMSVVAFQVRNAVGVLWILNRSGDITVATGDAGKELLSYLDGETDLDLMDWGKGKGCTNGLELVSLLKGMLTWAKINELSSLTFSPADESLKSSYSRIAARLGAEYSTIYDEYEIIL